MPVKLKVHAAGRMPWTADGLQYTHCERYVPRQRVAAVEAEVTCVDCLAAIRSDREWEAAEAARHVRNHGAV